MPITPETILSLSQKFMESRIFLTAAELDLFSLLAKGPLTSSEVADRLKITQRGAAILLDALVPMGLLQKQDGRYVCPAEVAELLSKDSPGSMMPMILLSAGGWRRWSELTEIVRHGATRAWPELYDIDPSEYATFVRAMHVIAYRMAPAIVAAINPGGARRLLDIGGALGAYTQAFLEAAPELCATLFDLPRVIQIARERFTGTDLARRITFVAGDFYRDELPADHDLALLSAIIHQNSSEQNLELYRKVYRALRPGGRLVIRDHVMSADHTLPAGGAFFAVNMLVATVGGSTYSFDEIRRSLEEAGFARISLLQSGERMDGLVEAFKP
ncbi:MAG: methyltransferase [Acidobacteriota bacterium]|jgi:SAM-dependent methyltransferase|nr:methyltransferase [Acidobacteriota bacterium]NLT33447.1 methyltransferase domain-containing protein [Acidobacteriota bacterium]